MGLILTGWKKHKLKDLSTIRSSSAIPVGGKYSAIDFVLSNMVNSGITNVGVMTQYSFRSLMDHLGSGKEWDLDRRNDGLFMFPPSQAGDDSGWYKGSADAIDREIKSLGPISRAERSLTIVFCLTALLWMFRTDIPFGEVFVLPGWTTLLSKAIYGSSPGAVRLMDLVDDGTVALLGGLALFLIPSGRKKGEYLMDWGTAESIPWGILLLFGGGFALAKGFTETELSHWIGSRLAMERMASAPVLVGVISLTITFLTELTSNTATTQIILPIVAGLAQEIQVNPLLLMIPATLDRKSVV